MLRQAGKLRHGGSKSEGEVPEEEKSPLDDGKWWKSVKEMVDAREKEYFKLQTQQGQKKEDLERAKRNLAALDKWGSEFFSLADKCLKKQESEYMYFRGSDDCILWLPGGAVSARIVSFG